MSSGYDALYDKNELAIRGAVNRMIDESEVAYAEEVVADVRCYACFSAWMAKSKHSCPMRVEERELYITMHGKYSLSALKRHDVR